MAVNCIALCLVTVIIHNIYGDMVFQGTRHIERLYETIIFAVLIQLLFSIVAIKRIQLVMLTVFSAVIILAHSSVLVNRFYMGGLNRFIVGYIIMGLFLIVITGGLTYISYTLYNKMIQKVEDLNINLEGKIAERTEELEKTNRRLKTARNSLWGEMQIAKKIQTVLLPEKPKISGYEISAYTEPALEVGGDYHDIINAGGRDWIVIGDVSGHGVSSGLVMMMVQTSIHSVLEKFPDLPPDELLEIVNPVILRNIQKLGDNKYMTITVMACHDEGNFYFSGLHQDILLYRSAAEKVESVETKGMWIGIYEEIKSYIDVENH